MAATRQIGPFEIEKQLGAGGMGVVYLATYTKTGQKVALKVLSPAMSSDEKLRARFEREMKILKKLRHDNIVRYFGGGRHKNQHYYAMEFVEGGSLEDLLKKKGKLPWEQVIDVGLQVARALEYAHQHGIIHRDLKPANLFFDTRERLKLGDFGIARDTQASTALTAAGRTVGTYAYMAPEQISGEHPVTGKTDLYALGCVMFQLLTGRPPFQAETSAQMLFKHLEETPPRVTAGAIDCPIWLEAVVNKLLAKNPDDRYYDALELQVALEEVGTKVAQHASIAGQTTAGGPTAVSIDNVHPELRKLLQSGKKKKKRKKKKGFVPFYERTWFLLVCLALLVGGVAWAMRPLSEEDLFRRGDELMRTESFSEWLEARDDYFQPYLKRFPDGQYAAQVRNYLDQIEMEVTHRRAEMTIKFNREPKSGAERLYVDALRYEQSGDRITSLDRFRDLINLFEGSEKDKPFVNLARKRSALLQPSLTEGEGVLDEINKALRKAERHAAAGEMLKAKDIWRSIVNVYGTNQEFEVQVNYARARQAGEDVAPLDFGSPGEKNGN